MTGPRVGTGPGGFTWNEVSGRYIGPDGRFVSRESVRRAIDEALRKNSMRARVLSNELREGKITLDAWYFEMRTAVKDANLYSAAAARGGWAQMTPSDFGAVGAAVRKQYAYLDRFAGEIDAGAIRLDGSFLFRAMTYMQSGRPLYESIVEDMQTEAGFTEEMNVLGAAEHCEGPGSCTEQTSFGVVPIGELVPIGDRLCRGNCRCRILRRKGPGSDWE